MAAGRVAAMLFNSGSASADILLDFARDLPELSAKWAQEVKVAGFTASWGRVKVAGFTASWGRVWVGARG